MPLIRFQLKLYLVNAYRSFNLAVSRVNGSRGSQWSITENRFMAHWRIWIMLTKTRKRRIVKENKFSLEKKIVSLTLKSLQLYIKTSKQHNPGSRPLLACISLKRLTGSKASCCLFYIRARLAYLTSRDRETFHFLLVLYSLFHVRYNGTFLGFH